MNTMNFSNVLEQYGHFPLTRSTLKQLQINVGYLCNQACEHCHVEAGPKRTEIMEWMVMEKIIRWVEENNIQCVDITGGAPEMNPNFRRFCESLIDLDIEITCRHNITVQYEPGQDDLVQWFAKKKIKLICSLPCYSQKNVDKQRGKGVFGKSISGLLALNKVGYGHEEELTLDLIYNPVGASLPPSQPVLEVLYKKKLKDDYGIKFTGLLTITNLPIKRFKQFLKNTGQFDMYQQLLADNFNADTVSGLMCRHLISVDWRGYVYDCDFNQMLNLSLNSPHQQKLWEINRTQLNSTPITLANHCYGCTAGAGSSCGGALT